ncbi:MAG: hypothetical protein LBK52_05730 [Deltaproteobacteria bacterium]|jgi:hypothetical protein|nr:hypothetical protein [Deltaproteobacteria bacterium]
MQILVSRKSLGRRRPALTPVPFEVPDDIRTLRDLIRSLVISEAERFNGRLGRDQLIPFLTEREIEDQAASGKVGFGTVYSEKQADTAQAVQTAFLGFEDGLFRAAVNDREAKTLDEDLSLKPGDTLTFIRLTFLAGRLW